MPKAKKTTPAAARRHTPTIAQCFAALDAIVDLFPRRRAESIVLAFLVQRLQRNAHPPLEQNLMKIIAESERGAKVARALSPRAGRTKFGSADDIPLRTGVSV